MNSFIDINGSQFKIGKKIKTIAKECEICGSHQSPHFCKERAEDFIYFIENYCYHQQGKYKGEVFKLADFQKDIMHKIYGIVFYDKETGKYIRLYKKVHILMPRRNGKSTWAAALGFAHLVWAKEKAPNVYIAASKMEQANIIFGELQSMAQASSHIKELGIKFNKSKLTLNYRDNSFAKIITSTGDTERGLNFSLILIDELLAIKKPEEFFRNIESSFGSRDEALLITFTTSSYDPISYERKLNDKKLEIIKDPSLEPRTLPINFAIEPDEDPYNIDIIRRVNPALGIYLRETDVLEEMEVAKNNPGSEEEVNYLTERLNSNAFMPMGICSTEELNKITMGTIDENRRLLKECSTLYAGVDLAHTHDLCALSIIGHHAGLNKYIICNWGWLPLQLKDFFNRRVGVDTVNGWQLAGNLNWQGQHAKDYENTCKEIVEIIKDHPNVVNVVLDSYRSWFLVEGLDNANIKHIKIPRASTVMSVDTANFQKLIRSDSIQIGNDGIFKFCAESCELYIDKNELLRINLPRDRAKTARRVDIIVSISYAFNAERNHPTSGVFQIPRLQEEKNPKSQEAV